MYKTAPLPFLPLWMLKHPHPVILTLWNRIFVLSKEPLTLTLPFSVSNTREPSQSARETDDIVGESMTVLALLCILVALVRWYCSWFKIRIQTNMETFAIVYWLIYWTKMTYNSSKHHPLYCASIWTSSWCKIPYHSLNLVHTIRKEDVWRWIWCYQTSLYQVIYRTPPSAGDNVRCGNHWEKLDRKFKSSA